MESSAKAGAANLASGLGHSAVNMIGNAGSAIAASVKKGKLYKNDNIIIGYQMNIAKTLHMMSYAVAEILNKETECKVWTPTDEAISKTETIMNNIENGYLNDSDVVKEKCLELLVEYPYEPKVYECLRERFDDNRGELDALAIYHGSNVIKRYKIKTIKELLSDINYYTLDTIAQGKKKFNEWAERYNVDTELYNKCLDDVRDVVETAAKTTDGVLYDTIENAQEIKRQILEIIEKINGTKGNDLEGIGEIINILEESSIESKKKYIDLLQDEIKQEDIRYRTVKCEIYETRELAKTARLEAEKLDEKIEDLSTVEKIEDLKKEIDEITTEDIKEKYEKYLEECKKVFDEQNVETKINEIMQTSLRKQLAVPYYEAQNCLKKAELFKCVKEKFENWFNEFNTTYCTINGKLIESPEDASKAYLKWVDHARKYFEYMQEKNASKKSLFGALKNATSGVIYKNYEGEYNNLTNGGEKAIPLDDKKDYGEIAEIKTNMSSEYYAYIDNMKNEYKRVFASCEMENKDLEASELLEPDIIVKADDVLVIMKECCENISVKENEYISKID